MTTPPPPEASAPSRPSFHIRPVPASATYALRHAVLWPDWPPAYVQLADDADGWHFGAFPGPPPPPAPTTAGAGAGAEEGEKEEEPISVLSLFLDDSLHHHPTDTDTGTRKTDNTTYYRFRKFATAVPWQGRGAGSALLRHVMALAAARQPEQHLDHDGVGGGGGGEAEEQEDGGKRRRQSKTKNSPGDGGGIVIWCGARQSALPFYARFGFAAAGDVFYKGDVPYLQMSRRLV